MSWTAPRTWVTSEVVSAAQMNTHVRDNLLETAAAKVTTAGDMVYATGANALARVGLGSFIAGGVGNYKHVVKASDETVSGSTTLQDDNELVLALGANQVWSVEVLLSVIPSSTGDLKITFTVPSGATGGFTVGYTAIGGGSSSVPHVAFATAVSLDLDGPGFIEAPPGFIHVFVRNSSNAGNLTLQWAQNSSAGTTTVKAGSFMRCLRLA